MTLGVPQDQPDLEPAELVFLVRLQEIRDVHLQSVRAVADRWEQGLRTLVGLTGIVGLIGAPLAVNTLTSTTQLVVGVLLAMVLITAAAGLLQVMAAAFGSVRTFKPPTSLQRLITLRESLAESGRTQLLWGRRLAVTALLLFAAAIAVGWANPGHNGPYLQVETNDGVTYCGPRLDSPSRSIAVHTELEGRVQIATKDVASVSILGKCPPENP
jgi:hypothetical protein